MIRSSILILTLLRFMINLSLFILLHCLHPIRRLWWLMAHVCRLHLTVILIIKEATQKVSH